MLLGRPAPQQAAVSQSTGGRGTLVTSSNVSSLLEQASQPMEDAYYRTRMSVVWEFGKSTEPSTTAYVENAPDNTRTVYFDVTLADTGDLVYSSPFIPLGGKLEGIALDAELPAGEHAAVVTYHLVDDDHREITTVSVGITLKIAG